MRFTIILSFVALMLAVSCHTFVFQPVEKQMEGSWIQSPYDPENFTVWTFENGMMTREIHLGDTIIPIPCNIEKNETGDSIISISYEAPYDVRNKITKHVLVFTDENCNPFPTVIDFLIVEAGKDKLYLSSKEKTDTGSEPKGGIQFGFVPYSK